MTRPALRKITAAGLSVVLIGSGLAVGLGAGVATAASAPSADCKSAVEVSSSQVGSTYAMTKEVVGGTVAPGAEVTFILTYRGAGGLLDELRDFAPAGFTRISAKLGDRSSGLFSSTEDFSTKAGGTSNATAIRGVWSTAANTQFVLQTVYRAPDNLVPGSQIFAGGGGFNVALVNGVHNWNPINSLCMTVRDKDITEVISGSLETTGLGSLGVASSNLARPFLDLGGSLGDLIGSAS